MPRVAFALLLTIPVFAATDSLTIYEVDAAPRTNLPVTLGRAFIQGEFPSGSCPQPKVNGTALAAGNWQFDLKNSWADGSVKFGVVSFIIPSLPAAGNVVITFQAAACTQPMPGALSQGQMINFNSGFWGAALQVSAQNVNGTPGKTETVAIDAGTMLAQSDPAAGSFGDCKNDYWLQGPVVTAVIVQDCTTATSYDFGWLWDGTKMNDNSGSPYSGNCGGTARCAASLHPWFVLYFYPSNNAVRADTVLENTWTDRAQDQLVNVSYLTGASSARTTQLAYTGVPRVLTDAIFAAHSDAVASASANFDTSDAGASWSSAFGDTTICGIVSATQATLCAPEAAGGSSQTVRINDWLWGQMYRKTFWTGSGNPGNILVDHNWPYMVSTRMIPPYDTAVSASPDSDVIQQDTCGVNAGSDWTCFSQQAITNLGFTQTWSDLGDRGGHGGLDESYSAGDQDPTPLSRQSLLYFTNMGAGCGTANSACAKGYYMVTGTRGARDSGLTPSVPGGAGIWNNISNSPYHLRESRTTAGSTGNYICPNLMAGQYAAMGAGTGNNVLSNSTTCGVASGTYAPFGRPFSGYYVIGNYSGSPAGQPAGSTFSHGAWTPVPIRWLEFTYPGWLVTGDPYYMLEMQMNGAFVAAATNGSACAGCSQLFFQFQAPGASILRKSAGTLDAILKARTVSPDGSLEQKYFDSILASNAEVWEGMMNLTGSSLTPDSLNPTCSSYNYNAVNRWDWGRCTNYSRCGASEPQGNACATPGPLAVALHAPVHGQGNEAWIGNGDAKVFSSCYATAGTTTVLDACGNVSSPQPGTVVYFTGAKGAGWAAINGNQTINFVGTVQPGAVNGAAYSRNVVTSLTGTLTWTITSGSLPPGLSLCATTTPNCTISGTPTANGAYAITINASNGTTNDPENYIFIVTPTAANVCGPLAATCTGVQIPADTTGASGNVPGALFGYWNFFGPISNITSSSSPVVTTNTTGAAAQYEVFGLVDQAGTNWSELNGLMSPASVSSTSFKWASSAPDTTGFTAFSQTGGFYTEAGANLSAYSDSYQGWMESMLGIVFNEMEGQGVAYFRNLALEMDYRIIEKILDPNYNPWLIGLNFQPTTDPSGGQPSINSLTMNPLFGSWAQILSALSPRAQTLNTFWAPITLGASMNPCTNHSYALLGRALAAYTVGITDTTNPDGIFTGADAWAWVNSHFPYFSSAHGDAGGACTGPILQDAQIKFAFAPLPLRSSYSGVTIF